MEINFGDIVYIERSNQEIYSHALHLRACKSLYNQVGNIQRTGVQDYEEVTNVEVSERGFLVAMGRDYNTRGELSFEKKIILTDFDLSRLCKRCQSMVSKYIKPVEISDGEWYYKGCIITEVTNHWSKFEVRKDNNDIHCFIGGFDTFFKAKKACEENMVLKPTNGLLSYLY